MQKHCPECDLVLPLGEFRPRHKADYEREDLPRVEDVERQSRCRRCNPVCARRRRFVHAELLSLAESAGVAARVEEGSVCRRIEVEVSPEQPFPDAVEKAVERFNASLPMDRCHVGRHGVRLFRAQDRGRPAQLLLPWREAKGEDPVKESPELAGLED